MESRGSQRDAARRTVSLRCRSRHHQGHCRDADLEWRSSSGTVNNSSRPGSTRTPDFRIPKLKAAALPLATTYRAVVDGTNGDVQLERVEAQLAESTFIARGLRRRHERHQGEARAPGRHVEERADGGHPEPDGAHLTAGDDRRRHHHHLLRPAPGARRRHRQAEAGGQGRHCRGAVHERPRPGQGRRAQPARAGPSEGRRDRRRGVHDSGGLLVEGRCDPGDQRVLPGSRREHHHGTAATSSSPARSTSPARRCCRPRCRRRRPASGTSC